MIFDLAKRYLLVMLLSVGGILTASAQYNPTNPDDPGEPATYMTYKVSATANMDGAGTVTGGGSYKYGTSVTLKATANTGYKFLYWLKDGGTEAYATTASITFTMADAAVSFVAVYEKQKTISVSLNDAKAGTVKGGGGYFKGTSVTISASTTSFYTFLYWLKDGEKYSEATSFNYEVGDDDVAFEAIYKAPATVTLKQNKTAGGTVSYAYANTADGLEAKISATVNAKYSFIHWLRNDETEAYTTETSFEYPLGDDDVTFTAIYAYNPENPADPEEATTLTSYNVSVGINDTDAGNISGAGKFQYGKSVTISTSANEGYKFVHWLKGDDEYSVEVSFSYTIESADVTFTAIYEYVGTDPEPEEPTSHKVYLTAKSYGSCTFDVASGTSVEIGSEYTVTAIPGTEYQFVGWYIADELVSTETAYTGTMGDADVTLVAVCKYVPEGPSEPEAVILLNRSRATMVHNGRNLTLNAVDMQGQAVTISSWTSSDTNVATVINGTVVYAGPGKATITATSADGQTATCEVTVLDILNGDVNGDGNITVADVSGAIKFVLEDTDVDNLYEEAADYNGNGVITVTDAISIAYIVLNSETEEEESSDSGSKARQSSHKASCMNAVLALNDADVSAGSSFDVPVNFASCNEQFISFQFDVTLPSGITFSGVNAGDNASEQTIDFVKKKGYTRVVGYSLSNTPFAADEGKDILYLNLTADDGMATGDYTITLSNIELVHPNISTENSEMQTLTVHVDGTTGIVSVVGAEQENGVYYDISGRHVQKPVMGLYIKDGRKVLVK